MKKMKKDDDEKNFFDRDDDVRKMETSLTRFSIVDLF